MKKSLMFLLAFSLLFIVSAGPLQAEDFKWPGETPSSEFEFNQRTGMITKYLGKGGVVVIPGEIDGVVVAGLAPNVFNELNKTEGHVTAVKIPASAKKLEVSVFNSCPELIRVEIPEGITALPASFLYSCKKIEEVVIPESVTSIGKSAFFGCNALKSVNFPKGLTEIGDMAFTSSSLTEIDLPDGIEVINPSTFASNYQLTSVKFPPNLKEIGKMAFSSNAMETLEIPGGVEKIGEKAFAFSNNLSSVKFPAALKEIGPGAFEACSSLEVPVLPEGLEVIGSKAFAGCQWTRSVAIPASVKSMGSGVFKNDNGTVWEITMHHVYEPSQMPELVKKEGEPGVFADVGQISIAWDATLSQTEAMDAWLLDQGEEELAWTEFNPEWKQYVNLDNLTFEKLEEGKIHVRITGHKAGEKGEKVAIPRDTFGYEGEFLYFYEIGDGAFKGQDLSFFGSYASLRRIGAEAFAGCKELREVFLPVSMEEIGDRAFADSGLRKIAIPESITDVSPDAFAGCWDLETVDLPASLEEFRLSHFTPEWRDSGVKLTGATKTIEGRGVTITYPEGTEGEINPFSKAPTVSWPRDEKGAFVDTKFAVYAERSKTADTPYDEMLAKYMDRKEKDYKDNDDFKVYQRSFKGHRCIMAIMDSPTYTDASYELRIYPDDGTHVS